MIHHNSQGPNLQNIPSVRKKDPHRVRKAFIAQPGCVLVVGDFSQAELRVLAHFSLDPVMVKAFQDDDDLHSISAKKFYGLDCALEEVKKLHDDLRAKAKTLNFAIMYGMAALSLASRLKIEIDEAERLLREYFGLYSGVQRWMMQNIGSCRNKGYVETILGRRRYLPDINSQDNGLRGGAERRATNSPIQGSVADLIKIAMVRLWEQHPWIVMRLQVHDELVCEVPKEREAEAKQLLGYVMEHAVDGLGFKVPWKASVSSGPNWDEAKG
jgi:DNA polymerase-1